MNNEIHNSDAMEPEYDFTHGVRGKHANVMKQGYRVTVHKLDGTTEERTFTLPEGVIALDPDVQAYFPDSDTVNRALRNLIALIPQKKAS
ncbi:hypothetical protein OSCT_2033 [Oscillochloris trichoides DG-6]|uniref:Uncharacterized protein n=1 Tax=Oscillochloris trichoides DG-6 TaxID=765420 RepID=E1IFD2_9CHLR|nr:hypothetical protein [Oscillochloris trichoides]EFO80102.1 hypothetical protein OSCT_2033 [Oscillochloris trichoides DG-6]